MKYYAELADRLFEAWELDVVINNMLMIGC